MALFPDIGTPVAPNPPSVVSNEVGKLPKGGALVEREVDIEAGPDWYQQSSSLIQHQIIRWRFHVPLLYLGSTLQSHLQALITLPSADMEQLIRG